MSDLGRALGRGASKTSVVIAVDLANYIISANLPEGATLPNEKAMADELGVGRASVREALRLLETRGIIRIRSGPGGGPIIRQPQPGDLSSALEFSLQCERATLGEVIHAREDLAPFTARLAATRATAAHVAELRDVIARLRADPNDHPTFAQQGRRFEGLLGAASGSIVVRIMADALNAIIQDTIPPFDYPLQRRRHVTTQLSRVVESVAEGDAEQAEAQMNAYVRNGVRYWRRFFPDLLSRPVRWTG